MPSFTSTLSLVNSVKRPREYYVAAYEVCTVYSVSLCMTGFLIDQKFEYILISLPDTMLFFAM